MGTENQDNGSAASGDPVELDGEHPAEGLQTDKEGRWVYRRHGMFSRSRERFSRGRDWWVATAAPDDGDIDDAKLPGWAAHRGARVVLAIVAVVMVLVWTVLLLWWVS